MDLGVVVGADFLVADARVLEVDGPRVGLLFASHKVGVYLRKEKLVGEFPSFEEAYALGLVIASTHNIKCFRGGVRYV